ncbi:hypothetical protein BGX38DRAFT_1227970 [Terfezia claveryi]|nr:hypothetical protein BGX38DRAFT_1227970 [Terfezia claveryi]
MYALRPLCLLMVAVCSAYLVFCCLSRSNKIVVDDIIFSPQWGKKIIGLNPDNLPSVTIRKLRLLPIMMAVLLSYGQMMTMRIYLYVVEG